MFHKRESAQELRNEVSQLRGDVDNLVGTMGRLVGGAMGSVRDTARSTFAAGGPADELYDVALEQGKRTARAAGQAVSEHPFLTAGIALGVGLLIGTVIARSRR
jgi:ElaB/YqjD/DUF883 family membrane-anchored ribosome-binding protein